MAIKGVAKAGFDRRERGGIGLLVFDSVEVFAVDVADKLVQPTRPWERAVSARSEAGPAVARLTRRTSRALGRARGGEPPALGFNARRVALF